ncbi:TPA: DUF3644 domain-containing protein [Legionella pneumophila]|nr:DUF3644 domain-containing protein [Legionella pneumophila]
MRRTSEKNLLELFEKLKEFESKGKEFSYADLNTKYKPSTIVKYLTTYLERYCKKTSKTHWKCSDLNTVNKEQYLILMSQKNTNPLDEGLSNRLIKRSKSAFLSSLAIYNNPTQIYRVESFAILLINAWELLLKHEICTAEGENKIFVDPGRNNTVSITDCINKQFKNNDPIRQNLEYVIKLRNLATHFFIPEALPTYTRLLFPTVKNYIKRYKNSYGSLPFDDENRGMINIIIEDEIPDENLLMRKYGKKSKEIISLINELESKSKEFQPDEFFISYDYKVAITKKSSDADITLSNGPNGEQIGILEKTVEIESKYPYKTEELVKYIKSKTSNIISPYDIYAVNDRYNIKQNQEYFKKNENVSRYSEAFVTWFISKINTTESWLDECRKLYRRSKNKKRKYTTRSRAEFIPGSARSKL